jgi:hypothetical protein
MAEVDYRGWVSVPFLEVNGKLFTPRRIEEAIKYYK